MKHTYSIIVSTKEGRKDKNGQCAFTVRYRIDDLTEKQARSLHEAFKGFAQRIDVVNAYGRLEKVDLVKVGDSFTTN